MKRSSDSRRGPWRRFASMRSTFNRSLLRRLVAPAVAVAVGVSSTGMPSTAYGVEEYDRFLTGLRQRHYFDMALDYLDLMRNSPLLTEQQRQLVSFEEARTYLEAARDVDHSERDKMLDGARDRFEKFVKEQPDHPQAAGAATQLGAVLVERGRNRVEQALLPSSAPDVKKKLMDEARPFFDQAEKTFTTAQEKFKALLDSFPKFMAPNDPRVAQREAAKGELIKAHMYHAYGLYERSRTYEKESADWKKALTTAAEKYGQIYKDYRTLIAGLSARLQEGKCYQELGDVKRALGLFNDLLGQPDDLKELRPFKASAMYLSLQCWTSDSEKMYELGSIQADEFLKAAANEDEDRPEWLAVRYYGAIAHKLWADSVAKDATGEEAKTRDQNYDKAREYAERVATLTNDYQSQARSLMKELSGGTADRPIRSFLEAQNRGLDSMNAFSAAAAAVNTITDKAMQDAKLKEADDARNAALAFYRQALSLADENTKIEDKNIVRYYICYLTYTQQKTYEAAVLGEYLLRYYPNSNGAKPAAQIALASYVAEYQANQEKLLNNTGTPVNPEFDRQRMYAIASEIAKRWSGDKEADNAWNILLAIAINEKNSAEILKTLGNIRPESEIRADAEMRAGRTLWALYSEQLILDDGTPGKMPAAEMQKLAAEANKILDQAMEREKPKIAGPANMSLQHAETQMFLCESRLATAQTAKALECIDDPKFGLLPLVRAAAQNPAATVAPIPLESVKLALQAYVLNNKVEEAQKLAGELSTLLGAGAGDQQLQLANTYLNLALRIEKQIDQHRQTKNFDALKQAAKGFTFFLGELVKSAAAFDENSRFQNLNWVSENYYKLGADLVAMEKATAEDKTTGIGYLDTSAKLDAETLSPMTQDGSDAQLVVKLRRARSLRKGEKYDEAVDAVVEILAKKPFLIEGQIDACETLMEKAVRKNDLGSTLLAITGGRPGSDGGNVIWGWRRIADTMRNSPQFQTPAKPADLAAGASAEDANKHAAETAKYQTDLATHLEFMKLYHTSRLKVAECYWQLAQATQVPEDRKKHLNAVVYTIDVTEQYTPDLGGDEWKPKYQELKNKAVEALKS
jgi:hypothetical protein